MDHILTNNNFQFQQWYHRFTGEDSGIGGPGSLDLRASAIAAVDAAENSMKTKIPKGNENILTPGFVSGPGVGVLTPGVSVGVNPISGIGVGGVVSDTELSSELSNFPDIVTGVKLVTLQAPPSASTSTSTSTLVQPLSGTTPHYTELEHTNLYYTILYYTILCYAILYNTTLNYTILYDTKLYYTTLYCTILCYTILYYTILYYTTLYYAMQYYTTL